VANPAHAAAEADDGAKAGHSRLAWRTWVPWTLVVLATVIGLISALNVWVKRQALSTDNWTNASSQLLENDKIRGAISVYLVDQLYQNRNVTETLQNRLPQQAKPLAAPIAAALEDVSIRYANRFLERPRVQELWRKANERAHTLFMAVLDGKHNVLVSTNNQVVLNLQPILQRLSEQTGLGSRLKGRLPPDAGKIVIMNGNQLEAARKTVKVVRVLSYLLFFLVIALYAVAIYLGRGRRRTLLMAAGIGVLIVGVILLVIRRYAGDYIANALTSDPGTKGAVSASWAIGTQLLKNTAVNALVYGIVIIFAAWIAGPSRPAVWSRRHLAPTMRNYPVVIYAVVAAVLLLVLLAGPTDAQRIYPLLILFVFAFIGTEVLRRQTLREFPPTPAEAAAG
jgi:hypothetical protein